MLISDWNQGRDSTIEPAIVNALMTTAKNIKDKEVLSSILFTYEELRNNFYNKIERLNSSIEHGIMDLEELGITLPENPTSKQRMAFNKQLISYIYKRCGENNGQSSYYGDFAYNYNLVIEIFDNLSSTYFNNNSSLNILQIFINVYPNIEDQINEKNNLLENFNSFIEIVAKKRNVIDAEDYPTMPEYDSYIQAINFINMNLPGN